MKQDRVKQIICISEDNAADFEERMNDALSNLSDPEIHMYENNPFTAVIVYFVKRNIPEDLLELFELVEGESFSCLDCPHYVRPTDKRRKWGECSIMLKPTRADSRACEKYYAFRYKMLSEAKERFLELPFTAE